MVRGTLFIYLRITRILYAPCGFLVNSRSNFAIREDLRGMTKVDTAYES